MSQPFAVGKHAFGFCDRCGFRYPLHDLRPEVIALQRTSIRVCPECFDPDNPQYQLGRLPISGPQALKDPRPSGATSGGVDTTNRWDFDTDADYWVPNAGAGGALTWQSADKTVILSYTGTKTDPGLMISGVEVGSAAISVDASEYTQVRCRVKINEFPDPFPGNWSGTCFWNRDVDAGDSFTQSFQIAMPNFYAMGDPWHVLTWDLRNNSNWSDTVVRLRFDLFRGSPAFDTGTLEFDYITVEKE